MFLSVFFVEKEDLIVKNWNELKKKTARCFPTKK